MQHFVQGWNVRCVLLQWSFINDIHLFNVVGPSQRICNFIILLHFELIGHIKIESIGAFLMSPSKCYEIKHNFCCNVHLSTCPTDFHSVNRQYRIDGYWLCFSFFFASFYCVLWWMEIRISNTWKFRLMNYY